MQRQAVCEAMAKNPYELGLIERIRVDEPRTLLAFFDCAQLRPGHRRCNALRQSDMRRRAVGYWHCPLYTERVSQGEDPSNELAELFPGRSESAALMRTIDWSSTPLGPTNNWPRSLRTLVPIMLVSRFAMRVLWGPEFIFLYNDSYRPILGASKHPSAMASRTAESFHEVWDIVGPLFQRVYAGEAIALEDELLPLDRNGYLEECFFKLSYSPIFDDQGQIGGVLGVVHETTEHVVAARRLRLLRELAAISASAGAAETVCARAAHTLTQNRIDVPFALFYLVDREAHQARLIACAGLGVDCTAAPAVIDLCESHGATWPFEAVAEHETQIVVSDLEARFGRLTAGLYPEPVHQAVVCSVGRRGADYRPYGFIVAGVNARRQLDDAYRGFFDLAVEHITAAISAALEQEERERSSARELAADTRLRLLFNEAPAGIALLRGREHIYELANPQYRQLVGRDNLLGRPGREAVPELIEQGVWDIFDRVFATGQPFIGREFEAQLDRSGDGTRERGFFNFIVQPMRDIEGTIEGVMVFAIEITELVVARRSEATARAAAEAGRAERTRLLASERAARADAERSSEAKDEFLAIVSHELRNPLSAMLGWARLLRTGALPADKHASALETIERNAVNQSQLIEDLLDISRIVSGKLRLEVRVVNFVELVRAAIDSARPAIEAKQLRLRPVLDSEALSLMGDATRLQQIAWNLLSNATKFTPKGGSIQVILKRVESMLELAVIDSGCGISAEFLPHVFDRFRQADGSTTRAHGGLGLGLSIAKNLVEMHGGTISVHSEGTGQGASFIVRLPVAPLRESRVAAASTSESLATQVPRWNCPPELAGLRVLVVDDELDAREMVASVLELCGSTVQRAGSVREALAMLQDSQPDVILSDIGMPGEDGFALVREIRSRSPKAGGHVPIASLTAYASAEDRRRALIAGFNMHVPKPIEPDELIAVVASLGRIARALR
jgi:PAS domain S-box-containing protein